MMTAHSHIKSNIHMKSSFDGGGGSHTHAPPSHTHRQSMHMADIALTYQN